MAELMTPQQRALPGYEGFLSDQALPFPLVLQDHGYRTYMAGKWHLGVKEEVAPPNRGFDQSYALMHGGASHFDQSGIITFDANKAPVALYRENGKEVQLPKDFYSSEFFASRLMSYIDADTRKDQPFFAYLAFTAPHWPLHAPEEYIRKYEGRYDAGYDVLREERLERMKKLGLVPRGEFERIARSTVSLVTDGFFERVASGRIVVKRDTQITELQVKDGHRTAILADGSRLPADIMICGTGWTQDVPFLDAETKARILDERGNFRLYKCILPSTVPNLAFNGYNSSFFSPLSAEMGALWIAALLAGDLKLPAVAEQLDATDKRLRWMEERTEGKHARGTNVIPFSMHQIDELLDDLRLPIGAMQRFMEWQMPIRPGNCRRISRPST